jgi:hypothetical protein
MSRIFAIGRRFIGGSLLAMFVLQAVPAGAVEEFHAFLAPGALLVPLDSLFVVRFAVDSTAHHFNAYEITLHFERGVVSFQSVAVGPRMLAACANQFATSSHTDSTVTFDNSLLCAGASVDGPGDLALFTFRRVGAARTSITITSNPDRSFYDAGLYVSPSHPTYPRQVIFTVPQVAVYNPSTDVPVPAAEAPLDFNVAFQPNPTRAGGFFRMSLPRAGVFHLDLFDLTGRRVLSETGWSGSAGERELYWGGVDPAGRPLTGGVYFARVGIGHDMRTTRVVLER